MHIYVNLKWGSIIHIIFKGIEVGNESNKSFHKSFKYFFYKYWLVQIQLAFECMLGLAGIPFS